MMVKPFLKWVGGKRQLLADIVPLVPDEFSRYIEPLWAVELFFSFVETDDYAEIRV